MASELENFSHRPHDAVGNFYLFVQIIETSLTKFNCILTTQKPTPENQRTTVVTAMLVEVPKNTANDQFSPKQATNWIYRFF